MIRMFLFWRISFFVFDECSDAITGLTMIKLLPGRAKEMLVVASIFRVASRANKNITSKMGAFKMSKDVKRPKNTKVSWIFLGKGQFWAMECWPLTILTTALDPARFSGSSGTGWKSAFEQPPEVRDAPAKQNHHLVVEGKSDHIKPQRVKGLNDI